MSQELGFALVGCGAIGEINATSIAEAEGAHLVRVADIDSAAAAALGARFEVPASTSLEETLEDPAVETVFIATPHDLHERLIIEAARAGRHVIVEKPLATDVAGARRAVASCLEAGVSLSVCHPRRYEPKVSLARQLVESGLIGRVLVTTSSFFKEKPADYWNEASWRGSRQRSGGGVLIMNLVHHLDALQVITNSRVVALHAFCGTLATSVEVEDTVAATLRFAAGALGTMAACSALPGPKVFDDTFFGSEGRLVVAKNCIRLFSRLASEYGPANEWIEIAFDPDRVSKRRFVEAFANHVGKGREPPVPASYGLDLIELIEGAYGFVEGV